MVNFIAVIAVGFLLCTIMGILLSQFMAGGATSNSSMLGNLYNNFGGYPVAVNPSPTFQPYLQIPPNNNNNHF